MQKIVLSNEQIEYLRAVAPGNNTSQIAQIINAKYALELTPHNIKVLKAKYGIRSGRHVAQTGRRGFIPEEIAWIKAQTIGKTTAELAEDISSHFGMTMTTRQARALKQIYGISGGVTGKGRKLRPAHYEKIKASMFKPGRIPSNKVPVHTERITVDGYIDVKIAEPDVWKAKQRLVWEQHNGPIPKGMVVLFADGNKLNCSIENLRLVSLKERFELVKKKMIFPDPKLTDTGLLLVKNDIALREIQRRQTRTHGKRIKQS